MKNSKEFKDIVSNLPKDAYDLLLLLVFSDGKSELSYLQKSFTTPPVFNYDKNIFDKALNELAEQNLIVKDKETCSIPKDIFKKIEDVATELLLPTTSVLELIKGYPDSVFYLIYLIVENKGKIVSEDLQELYLERFEDTTEFYNASIRLRDDKILFEGVTLEGMTLCIIPKKFMKVIPAEVQKIKEERLKKARNDLVKYLKEREIVTDSRIIKAMERIPRHFFIPKDYEFEAYEDQPIPISEDQTESAPHMVGLLLQLLNLSKGDKVLVAGAKAGYTAALIADIIGQEGRVFCMEKNKILAEKARDNLKKTGFADRTEVWPLDPTLGSEDAGPWTKILVLGSVPDTPDSLIKQLDVEGVMVVPVGSLTDYQELLKITRTKEGKIEIEKKGKCAFVPLIGKYGWTEAKLKEHRVKEVEPICIDEYKLQETLLTQLRNIAPTELKKISFKCHECGHSFKKVEMLWQRKKRVFLSKCPRCNAEITSITTPIVVTTRINRVLVDTSVVVNQLVSKLIDTGILHDVTILVPEAVVAELEQLRDKKENGLRELDRIKEKEQEGLIRCESIGERPSFDITIIDMLKLREEVDHMIYRLAEDKGAVLLTSDVEMARKAVFRNINCVLLKT